MRLDEIARAVGAALHRRRVPSMLVGGLAVTVHAKPRTTQDVDIVVFVEPRRAADLVAAVEDAGLEVARRAEAIRRLRKLKPVKVGTAGHYHVDLRIASWRIDDQAYRRSSHTVANGTLALVPPEELVAYKLARGDDQDRADIRAVVEATRNFDWDRTSRATIELADELGRPSMLERLRAIRGQLLG